MHITESEISKTGVWRVRNTTCLMAGFLLGYSLAYAGAQSVKPYNSVFRTAVAVWHMQDLQDAIGKNGLKAVGATAIGVALTGKERTDSLALGNDGVVADLNGGYL